MSFSRLDLLTVFINSHQYKYNDCLAVSINYSLEHCSLPTFFFISLFFIHKRPEKSNKSYRHLELNVVTVEGGEVSSKSSRKLFGSPDDVFSTVHFFQV